MYNQQLPSSSSDCWLLPSRTVARKCCLTWRSLHHLKTPRSFGFLNQKKPFLPCQASHISLPVPSLQRLCSAPLLTSTDQLWSCTTGFDETQHGTKAPAISVSRIGKMCAVIYGLLVRRAC